MIVLDAVGLIGLLNRDDAHHVGTVELLRDTESEPRTSSPINVAEALVAASRVGAVAEAVSALSVWRIDETPLPPDASLRLASLRAMTARKMPDCCALLTAQQTGGQLLTFDEALVKSARALGISVLR